MNRPIRVLYLHGLEETQKSPKPQLLATSSLLETHIPALEIYITKRNGFIRGFLTNRRVLGSFAGAVASYLSLQLVVPTSYPLLISFVALGALLSAQKSAIVQEVVRSCLEKTYRVALKTLEDLRRRGKEPDVLVGFSWGGCLACALMKYKQWEGPTVLLGPAYHELFSLAAEKSLDKPKKKERVSVRIDGKVFDYTEPIFDASKAGDETEVDLFTQSPSRDVNPSVRVVVGEKDSLVNPERLKAFCHQNRFELSVIPGEPHKLWGFTELPRVIVDLYEKVQALGQK